MFNFTGVLLDGFQSTGHLGTGGGIATEEQLGLIFLSILMFVTGMLTHYAYIEIKKNIKKDIEAKKDKKKDKDDKRE